MCTKLRTVAASNNRVHPTKSLYYCLFAPHIFIVVRRAHPVRGESHFQRNASGEVATEYYSVHVYRAWSRKFRKLEISIDTDNFRGFRAKKTDRTWLCVRGRTGSQDSAFFLSDTDPNTQSKICEKPDLDPESLFNFGSSRSLCGHFLSKNMGKSRLD